MGRLIIDGLTMLEDIAQGSNVSWHISSPIYVGGVPGGKAQRNVPVSLCGRVLTLCNIGQLKRMNILLRSIALNNTVSSYSVVQIVWKKSSINYKMEI